MNITLVYRLIQPLIDYSRRQKLTDSFVIGDFSLFCSPAMTNLVPHSNHVTISENHLIILLSFIILFFAKIIYRNNCNYILQGLTLVCFHPKITWKFHILKELKNLLCMASTACRLSL